MPNIFDRDLWSKNISKIDWYLYLGEDFKRIENTVKELPRQEREEIVDEIYDYVGKSLSEGILQVNETGPNWDDERKTIDTLIVHHSSRANGLTNSRLNVMHLLRLYVPFFTNPSQENREIKGRAVWSGHFVDQEQVFYGYHWLVKQDGSIERLLDDKYIGWHAGNWDINARSVGICLDDDLELKSPNSAMLGSLAKLIKKHYSQIEKGRILGHREVHNSIICPGNEFIPAWREQLLNLI